MVDCSLVVKDTHHSPTGGGGAERKLTLVCPCAIPVCSPSELLCQEDRGTFLPMHNVLSFYISTPACMPSYIDGEVCANLSLFFSPRYALDLLQGMVLVFLRRQALRVRQECDHHPIAMRIRTDPFYSHYLLPRFEDYYALRGWEFPNVGALGWIRSRRCVGSADNTTTTSRGRTRVCMQKRGSWPALVL